jgi:DNA invertase Pin-like site-specific DNA recombinase
VIYGRQSRTADRSESLDTQVEACRATADHHKIEVVDVILEPPSTSAYRQRGRARPRFGEVLKLIRTGAVDCVVAYKTDRLSRGGGIGWAPLVEAAEDAGLDVDRFVLVAGNGFMSEFELGIRATMDREESKKTSERLCDVKARHAAAGKPWGGGARPFGYSYNKTTKNLEVVPAEARMIREAATALIAGRSQSTICREWNATGKTAAQGGLWRPSRLRAVMVRSSIAGLRSHHGEITHQGTWEPILDRPTWERVVGLLAKGSAERTPSYRLSLLTGLARCGLCGAPLTVGTKVGRAAYWCQKAPGKPGCGRLAIVAGPLEELITAAVIELLDRSDLGPAMDDVRAGADAVPPEVTEDEAMLAELATDWASKTITRAEYLAARDVIAARIDERLAQARVAALASRPRATDVLAAGKGTIAERWDALDRPARRAILGELIESIAIGPARRGLGRFDPSRVRVTWKA